MYDSIDGISNEGIIQCFFPSNVLIDTFGTNLSTYTGPCARKRHLHTTSVERAYRFISIARGPSPSPHSLSLIFDFLPTSGVPTLGICSILDNLSDDLLSPEEKEKAARPYRIEV